MTSGGYVARFETWVMSGQQTSAASDTLASAVDKLCHGLAAAGAAWGQDDIGRGFFNGGDGKPGFGKSRDEVLGDAADMVNLLRSMGRAMVTAGQRYAAAEQASTLGAAAPGALSGAGQGDTTAATYRQPGASGGMVNSDPPPAEWMQILHLIESLVAGCQWPDGSLSALGSMRDELSAAAAAFGQVTDEVESSARAVTAHNSGTATQDFASFAARLTGPDGLPWLAGACRGLASSVDNLIRQKNAARLQFEISLAFLAATFIAAQALAVFTFGASEAGFLAAAETEATALRIFLQAVLRAVLEGMWYSGGMDAIGQFARMREGLQEGFQLGEFGKALGEGAVAGGVMGGAGAALAAGAGRSAALTRLAGWTEADGITGIAARTTLGSVSGTAGNVAAQALFDGGHVDWGQAAEFGVGMAVIGEGMKAGQEALPGLDRTSGAPPGREPGGGGASADPGTTVGASAPADSQLASFTHTAPATPDSPAPLEASARQAPAPGPGLDPSAALAGHADPPPGGETGAAGLASAPRAEPGPSAAGSPAEPAAMRSAAGDATAAGPASRSDLAPAPGDAAAPFAGRDSTAPQDTGSPDAPATGLARTEGATVPDSPGGRAGSAAGADGGALPAGPQAARLADVASPPHASGAVAADAGHPVTGDLATPARPDPVNRISDLLNSGRGEPTAVTGPDRPVPDVVPGPGEPHPVQAPPRDIPSRDAAPGDTATRGTAVHDTATRDTPARDTPAHDTATRDTAVHDTATRDTAVHDAAARDTAAHDTAAHDTALRDGTAQPGAHRADLPGQHHQVVREISNDHPDLPISDRGRYVYGEPRSLYGREIPVFDGEPSPDQLFQGRLGDCGMIATLRSLARTDPEAIKTALRENPDGTVTMRVHETRLTGDGVAEPTGRIFDERMSPDLPVERRDPGRPAYANVRRAGARWSGLMEKGIAGIDKSWSPERAAEHLEQFSRGGSDRGFARLGRGSFASDRSELLSQLTGEPAHVITWNKPEEAAATWKQLLDEGKPVIASTLHDRADPSAYGLVSGHAYEITGVEDGHVILKNPWGYHHPDPIPISELGQHLSGTVTTLGLPEYLRHMEISADHPGLPVNDRGRYVFAEPRSLDGQQIPLFNGRPDPEQVAQGKLGDAGLMATLGAVARTHPEAIEAALRPNADGTVTLRVHETVLSRDWTATPTGRVFEARMSPDLPTERGNPGQPVYADVRRGNAAWPGLMEKGLAGIDKTWSSDRIVRNADITRGDPGHRGYARLDVPSTPAARAELLTQITGQPARIIHTSEQTNEGTAATWKQLLDEGKPAIVAARRDRADPSAFNIVTGQVYEVTGVTDGHILLRNPWGRHHPEPVPVGELRSHLYTTVVTLDPPAAQAQAGGGPAQREGNL